MIRRLCVDECVGATGNLSPPMSNKAKKASNRLTVLFVNSNKLAPGLYGDGNNPLPFGTAVRQPKLGIPISRARRQSYTRHGAWHRWTGRRASSGRP
jgi:hypothetical protein